MSLVVLPHPRVHELFWMNFFEKKLRLGPTVLQDFDKESRFSSATPSYNKIEGKGCSKSLVIRRLYESLREHFIINFCASFS